MVVLSKHCGEMVYADLATKIRIRRLFTEREFTLRASPAAFDIGFGTIERHPLERGGYDILADSAGGA
jgi:hypothetical protein